MKRTDVSAMVEQAKTNAMESLAGELRTLHDYGHFEVEAEIRDLCSPLINITHREGDNRVSFKISVEHFSRDDLEELDQAPSTDGVYFKVRRYCFEGDVENKTVAVPEDDDVLRYLRSWGVIAEFPEE